VTFVSFLVAAAFGLLAGSVIWTLADKRIRATVPNLRAICLNCGASKSWRSWLPFAWAGETAVCPSCGDSDASTRRVWEVGIALWFGVAWTTATPPLLPVLLGALPLLLILAVDLKVQAVFLTDCYVAVVAGLILGLSYSTSQAAGAALGMGLAMAVCALFLVISRWIFRSIGIRTTPIGLSDVYIAAAVGAIVRFDGLLPALVAGTAGALLYWTVAPVVRPSLRTRTAALGPFLCLGGLVSLIL
jgi:prepilin signal peptidase PulO-like enzyme (type II secretory pathway)